MVLKQRGEARRHPHRLEATGIELIPENGAVLGCG
jgi:hypothetical protein